MARPGRKRVVRAVCTVCVNVSGLRDAPWPRWRSARSDPHKSRGVERCYSPIEKSLALPIRDVTRGRDRVLPSSAFENLARSSAAELVGVARPRCGGSASSAHLEQARPLTTPARGLFAPSHVEFLLSLSDVSQNRP